MAIRFYEPKYYMLSNLSAHAVEFQSKLYPTSEHAYQASKFDDDKVIEKIWAATSPLEAKQIARDNYGTEAEKSDWKKNKVRTMENILRAKLAQHTEVKEALLSTGSQEIIEDSPLDAFWGCGKDGKGQSQLGKLWMKLRDELAGT